jgi:hypothetical protein
MRGWDRRRPTGSAGTGYGWNRDAGRAEAGTGYGLNRDAARPDLLHGLEVKSGRQTRRPAWGLGLHLGTDAGSPLRSTGPAASDSTGPTASDHDSTAGPRRRRLQALPDRLRFSLTLPPPCVMFSA